MQVPLSTEEQTAVATRKLATPNCLQSMANHFAIGKLMAAVAVQICLAMQSVTALSFIHLANSQETMDRFASLGFSNCIEAVNSRHITIISPVHHGCGFINASVSYVPPKPFHIHKMPASQAGCTMPEYLGTPSSLKWSGEFAPGLSNIKVEGVTAPPLPTENPAYLLYRR